MTTILLQLLLAGGPPWLVWSLTASEPEARTVQVVVRATDAGADADCEVQVDPDATAGEPTMVWVSADCDGEAESDGPQHIVVQAVGGDGVAQGATARTKLVRVLPRGDAAVETDRGWLGVTVLDVPSALADQLNLAEQGVMVGNVVTGSPADQAGFQANDIILSINGEGVLGEVGQAVDLIKSRKPGDAVSVVVLRNGEQTTLNATLGSRAQAGPQAFAWKFQTGPEGEVEESVKTRGKFIARGPNGQWIARDLGDLSLLPEGIKGLLPQSGQRSTTVHVEDGKKVIKTTVERDGSSITVERTDDGPITVERTDAAGKDTTQTYDTEEALEAADAEAYEVFEGAGHVAVLHLDGDHDFDFDFDFDFDPAELHEQWSAQMGEASEAYHKAMEQLHAALQDAKVKGLGDIQGLMKGHHGAFALMGKPRQSFEVRTDGTIELRVRKGDSELIQLFKNEADLKTRDPEAYEKYEELMSDKE